jgi:hypothetical protein
VRNRLRLSAVATMLVAVFSVTIASASSPKTGGADGDAAPAARVAVTPIQRLSLNLRGAPASQGDQEGSTETAARVVDKVGQVPGFCRLHS